MTFYSLRLEHKLDLNLANEIAMIPRSTTSLDLSYNGLGSIPIDKLITIFTTLPPVISLDLTHCELEKQSVDQWITLLKSIPASVRSLNLSSNWLCFYSDDDLKHLLATMPPSVQSLDLSNTHLNEKSPEALMAAFSMLPATVISLNLSRNNLGEKLDQAPKETVQALAAIPKTITRINLSSNYFFEPDYNKTTTQQRDRILNALTSSLTGRTINLNNNGESNFARAILAVMGFIKQGYVPIDIGAKILYHTLSRTQLPEENSVAQIKAGLNRLSNKSHPFNLFDKPNTQPDPFSERGLRLCEESRGHRLSRHYFG